jgi:hypothetical protein
MLTAPTMWPPAARVYQLLVIPASRLPWTPLIPGDEILVAAGTYTGVNVCPRNDFITIGVVTQVVYISKTVTTRGGYTTTNWTTPYPITQPTTLDAQGQGRVLYITGDISPTIEDCASPVATRPG